MPSFYTICFDEERIEIRLPTSLHHLCGRNHEGEWLSFVRSTAIDVESGELKNFESTAHGGNDRPTREEIARQIGDWIEHEVLEQLGCNPSHYDGPDMDER